MASQEQAESVKAKYGAEMLRRPGVFAISLQRAAPDEFILNVYIDPGTPLPDHEELEGVTVKFEHQERLRPL